MSDGLFDQGMQTRRAVLGDAHVDNAESIKSEFDMRFQEMIVQSAWGQVWSGDQFTKRERSLVTLALLAALGHDEEFAMHVRATKRTGASASDIAEVLMHVAIYAGVPAANSAFKIAKSALDQVSDEQAEEGA